MNRRQLHTLRARTNQLPTDPLVIQEVDAVQRKMQGTFQFTATGLVCLIGCPYDCKYEDVHMSGRFTAIYDTTGDIHDYLH